MPRMSEFETSRRPARATQLLPSRDGVLLSCSYLLLALT